MDKSDFKKKNIVFNKSLFVLLLPVLVALGKLVRYTILKKVLVDQGIGHNWIGTIVNGGGSFSFIDTDGAIDAGGNSVFWYRVFNIFHLSTYGQFEVAITIIFNIILLLLLIKVVRYLTFNQMIFIAVSIAVLNIFDFTLAKEPVQMVYFIFIFAIILRQTSFNAKMVEVVLLLLLTAITFRSYYVLVAFFFVCSALLFRFMIIKSNKYFWLRVILVILIMGLIYYIFLKVCNHISRDTYEELIRVRTRVSDAATDMRNIFKATSLEIFTVDYMIMVVRMLFPVELLKMGVKYFPYVGYQIILTLYIINAIKNVKTNGNIKNIALYLYIGFLFASAAFEPDFGSWIRHEAVLFPLYLIIINSINIKDKVIKKKKIRIILK